MSQKSLFRWILSLASAGVLLLMVQAAHAQEPSPPILSEFFVDPPVVSPGDSLTYALSLTNQSSIESHVTVTATLPAGFQLSLVDLPVGASYNLRSGVLNWKGKLPPNGARQLEFLGEAPADPLQDGRLTAYAAIINKNQMIHQSAEGWAGRSPTAIFTHTLSLESVVDFMNKSEGTGPLSYWWDFGDGSTSIDEHPSHHFPAGGEYLVRLTVANPKGTASVSAQIEVPRASNTESESPPRYDVSISDQMPAVGQPIRFRATAASPSVSVHWNFGDGTTSEELEPVHLFLEPGIYTVTRILGEGETAVQSIFLLNVDFAPQASIQISSDTVSIGELVTYTATTTAKDVSDYFWDFGDGKTADHVRVTHSYNSPGDYLVTLAISNEFGVDLDTLTLHVYPYILYLPIMTQTLDVNDKPEPTVEAQAKEIPVPMVEITPPPEPEPTPDAPVDPFAAQMLQAVNAEREAMGLAPLSWADELARSAEHHSMDMAAYGFTGHYGSNGSAPIDRMRQASYAGDYAGECTAWGFDDITSAVGWWMTSPPHRSIILSSVATEMGGGYGYNPGAPSVHYWTIDFGAR